MEFKTIRELKIEIGNIKEIYENDEDKFYIDIGYLHKKKEIKKLKEFLGLIDRRLSELDGTNNSWIAERINELELIKKRIEGKDIEVEKNEGEEDDN